jgi:hypothetical protein
MHMCWFNTVLGWLDTHNGAITALATGVIAWFTISLSNASKRQARLSADQIKLGREEFEATHRPKLRIRNVAFDWGRTDTDWRPRIYFAIVNVGETTATEIQLRVDALLKENGKWDAPIDHWIESISPRLIGDISTGDRQICFAEVPATNSEVLIGGLTQGTTTGKPAMCIAGSVTYRNKMGVGYTTFFVREFDHVLNTFKPSADPEENYED